MPKRIRSTVASRLSIFSSSTITCLRSSVSTISVSGVLRPAVHEHLVDAPARLRALVGLRGGVVDADRLLDDVQLLLGQPEQLGDFFVGRRPAEFVGQLVGGPPPLGQQFDHVRRDADGLGGVDQGPLDALLDPVAGVGAEAGVHVGVEPLDRAEQAEVAFFDQVLQGQALAGVAAGDVDHQPQVGPDHPVAGLGAPPFRCRGRAPFPRRRSGAVSLISRR